MALKLHIAALHPASSPRALNEEWLILENRGDAPFNAAGCSITLSRGSGRPRQVTTLKAGIVVHPGEKVRLVSGSAGKSSHGEPPADDVRNVHLFLKGPYLDRPGATVRLVSRQHELARARLDLPAAGEAAAPPADG